MRQFIPAIALVSTLAAALIVPGTALAQESATMSLQGSGTVTTAPDMATLTSGVVTQAKTAREALSANTEAMSALVSVIRAADIADRDIQTSGFSITPQYVYSDEKDESGYKRPPKIVSYQVSNTVTVRVRDLDQLGTVLDQMVTAGSNTIGSISFGVAETGDLLNEARRKAMADARAKAALYAEAADVCLERITAISEASTATPQPTMLRAVAMEMSSTAVPVEAGELSYSMNVSVTWELGEGPCN